MKVPHIFIFTVFHETKWPRTAARKRILWIPASKKCVPPNLALHYQFPVFWPEHQIICYSHFRLFYHKYLKRKLYIGVCLDSSQCLKLVKLLMLNVLQNRHERLNWELLNSEYSHHFNINVFRNFIVLFLHMKIQRT